MQLLILLIAHHIADVAFQPSWLINNKKTNLWAIFEHSMVYAGVLTIALLYLNIFQMWMFFFILIGHFITDLITYQGAIKAWGHKPYWVVYPDQVVHYIQIAVLLWSV